MIGAGPSDRTSQEETRENASSSFSLSLSLSLIIHCALHHKREARADQSRPTMRTKALVENNVRKTIPQTKRNHKHGQQWRQPPWRRSTQWPRASCQAHRAPSQTSAAPHTKAPSAPCDRPAVDVMERALEIADKRDDGVCGVLLGCRQ